MLRQFLRQWVRWGMLAAVLAAFVWVNPGLMPQNQAFAYSPQALYDEVWKLINTRFVDEHQNGQEWGIWRHRFDNQLETDEDAYLAIDTMLASLGDRYTRFLDPEEFADEGRSIQAMLYGIGIQIGTRDDKLVIIAPIEDTPADKAGLKSNDEILQIDDKSTQGMSVKDAAQLIRGEKGSKVKLLVQRKDHPPKLYEVMRDEIKLKSVSLKNPFNIPIPKRIGYLKLSSFLSNNAAFEVRDALKELSNADVYILDLRSNPGGLLSNAITIADYFLDQGAIVSTVDRDGYKEVRSATPRDLTDKPLVVLIDGGSASASEILSGALRDNNRAILIGEKSFGKGLVQEINQLPGGAGVNITTQRYLTPNDTDINRMGIQPDITVEMKEEDFEKQRDPQLLRAIDVAQDLLSGKSMKYLQSRDLTRQATVLPTEEKSASAVKASAPQAQ